MAGESGVLTVAALPESERRLRERGWRVGASSKRVTYLDTGEAEDSMIATTEYDVTTLFEMNGARVRGNGRADRRDVRAGTDGNVLI